MPLVTGTACSLSRVGRMITFTASSWPSRPISSAPSRYLACCSSSGSSAALSADRFSVVTSMPSSRRRSVRGCSVSDIEQRCAELVRADAVMRQLQQTANHRRIGGRHDLDDVLRRLVDQVLHDPAASLDHRHRAVGDDADGARGVVADDQAVDPDGVRRVILIRVHPLVQQQQLRRLPLHDQHQAVAAIGEAARSRRRDRPLVSTMRPRRSRCGISRATIAPYGRMSCSCTNGSRQRASSARDFRLQSLSGSADGSIRGAAAPPRRAIPATRCRCTKEL